MLLFHLLLELHTRFAVRHLILISINLFNYSTEDSRQIIRRKIIAIDWREEAGGAEGPLWSRREWIDARRVFSFLRRGGLGMELCYLLVRNRYPSSSYDFIMDCLPLLTHIMRLKFARFFIAASWKRIPLQILISSYSCLLLGCSWWLLSSVFF